MQNDALDGAWMARLFPKKDEAKRAEWLRVLQSSGCVTLHGLTQLDAEKWRELGAPARARPPPGSKTSACCAQCGFMHAHSTAWQSLARTPLVPVRRSWCTLECARAEPVDA